MKVREIATCLDTMILLIHTYKCIGSTFSKLRRKAKLETCTLDTFEIKGK